jgi:outer membrane protein assembly factor BamB
MARAPGDRAAGPPGTIAAPDRAVLQHEVMTRLLRLCLFGFALSMAAGLSARPAQPPAGGRDWTRFGWDAGRSDASTAPTGIDAANLPALKRQRVDLDGTVDASAIYLHGVTVGGATHDVFFVTTTYGRTLAVDADNGAILWRFTPPGYSSWVGTYRITTATPVADPDRRHIYAASPDGEIRKLTIADGRPVWTTSITTLAQREKIASALNLFNGRVIATTGGYIGDTPPYQGHVAILDAASGKLLHVWNSLCSDRAGLLDPRTCRESDSAIWGRAGAVIDAGTGNIFVATGNALWDGRTFWGDATLELDPDATHLLGNYTPSDTEELNDSDQDVGSTSPVLLGGGYVAQGGKDGHIRLLRWEQMRGAAPHRGGEAQMLPTPGGTDLFTAPAVLRTAAGTWLFVADNDGTAVWTLRDGRLRQVWRNDHAGTSPIVAGGLLYVYDPDGGLRVYEPLSGHLVTTLECDAGHWNSPIVIDGRIALPEGDANAHRTTGVLDIWRLSTAGGAPQERR